MNQMNERLTSVERDVAVLTKVAAVERANYVTREDMAEVHKEIGHVHTEIAILRGDISRIDAVLTMVQSNCATKADLAQLETRLTRWMIATLIGAAGMNVALVLVVIRLMR